jgi:hypothetical protein
MLHKGVPHLGAFYDKQQADMARKLKQFDILLP